MIGAGQRETITDPELFTFAQSFLWSVIQLRTGKNETRSARYETRVYKKKQQQRSSRKQTTYGTELNTYKLSRIVHTCKRI